jgi:putative transposase
LRSFWNGPKSSTLGVRPRVISDNGPQFIAKDFKEFIRISGMTHVRTSPYYPQSNGKIERWHKSLRGECIRPGTPLSLEDARRLVKGYVEHYNNVRLNSAIGYITPKDMLAGHQQEIQAERDRKLETAKEQRKNRRHWAARRGLLASCRLIATFGDETSQTSFL